MIFLYIWLGLIAIMATGYFIMGVIEDKDIWGSAIGNFKHKSEQKKREKHESKTKH